MMKQKTSMLKLSTSSLKKLASKLKSIDSSLNDLVLHEHYLSLLNLLNKIIQIMYVLWRPNLTNWLYPSMCFQIAHLNYLLY
jgi:hypothetical protein